MAAVDPKDVATRKEDNKENNNDDEPDEGAWAKGALLKVAFGECIGYRWRF